MGTAGQFERVIATTLRLYDNRLALDVQIELRLKIKSGRTDG